MIEALTGLLDSFAVLEIFGELDHTTASELRERIAALTLRPGQRLVLGLGGMPAASPP
ncbi:hypothetical protein GCM10010300_23610 [Streptomyces olivaceoviridis]|nr:hypothetical protein GCM10010300_23610 [Streptomyces olivaceoviridis]